MAKAKSLSRVWKTTKLEIITVLQILKDEAEFGPLRDEEPTLQPEQTSNAISPAKINLILMVANLAK